MSTFRGRNLYYLRISEKSVLPLYLYLDDRHLDWMSDRVLQHVLEDLRPNILPKLRAESDAQQGAGSAKKGTVETHRGDTYQFCYFLRKTQPHSVLMKTRTFIAAPPRSQMPPPPRVPLSSKSKGKRKQRETVDKPTNAQKKRKTKGKGKTRITDSDEEAAMSNEDDDDGSDADGLIYNNRSLSRRRSGRAKRLVAGGHNNDGDVHEGGDQSPDVEMSETVPQETTSIGPGPPLQDDVLREPTPAPMEFDLEIVEEEENKPKPMLQLKYQGFSIFGSCLCIVVEPWPPVRSSTRAPSLMPTAPSRAPSIAPPDFIPSGGASSRLRERTPLFLPDDDDDRGRSVTPAPSHQQRLLPPVPLFDESEVYYMDDDDEDGGGMMEFSQVLNSAGDVRAGALYDDDDMDGAVFFGDADEVKEL